MQILLGRKKVSLLVMCPDCRVEMQTNRVYGTAGMCPVVFIPERSDWRGSTVQLDCVANAPELNFSY